MLTSSGHWSQTLGVILAPPLWESDRFLDLSVPVFPTGEE